MHSNSIPLFLVSLGMLLCPATALAETAPAANEWAVQVPSREYILQHLNKEHPRLLIAPGDFDRIKGLIAADKRAADWYKALLSEAKDCLDRSPSEYVIPDGKRLLATSRRVMGRVYLLALTYRIEGDVRYKERLWKELEAAARFKDWNPSHFLDTAELSHAFAIAYDWLYSDWTPEQRATIRKALIEHGLLPALKSYRGQERYGWWVKSPHNWNTVCNGGITLGALAIADEEPEMAVEVIRSALGSVPCSMASFAPDGGWAEGPGYWHYTVRYAVPLIAALETALGEGNFGISAAPGFSETCLFPLYMTGPAGEAFNFADSGSDPISAPEMFWLARRFHHPAAAWFETQNAEPDPLDLLWYDPQAENPQAGGLPLAKLYEGVQAATLRSAWLDPNALFVGLKAGDNKINHSHLDLGSFVLEADGVRWAVDLGGDNYNLPGYFDTKSQRWTYYRMRPEGHNTLVINPSQEPGQDPRAVARFTRFEPAAPRSFGVVDLAPAYADQANSLKRAVRVLDQRQMLLVDEMDLKGTSEVWWFLHTQAAVEISGTLATLRQEGKTLEARILSPEGAVFTAMAARPLPSSPDPQGQRRSDRTRKLAIRLQGVQKGRLAVLFTPSSKPLVPPAPLPAIDALDPDKW